MVGIRKQMMPSRVKVYRGVKRGLDFVIASAGLVIMAPLFLILIIVIKIDSPGPAFFRQERVGRGGKIFEILKFRSMVVENDMGDVSCGDKYTRVGKFLRVTSLDELPQLINVVRGEMAFIGPRPWVMKYWENMNERERMRALVRPGITGLAQAKGRNGISVFERIRYDLEYVEKMSFLLDVKIVLLTAKMVLKRSAAEAGKAGILSDVDSLRYRNIGHLVGVVRNGYRTI